MQPTAEKKSRSSRRLRLDGTGGDLLAAAVLVGLGGLSMALVGDGPDWAMPRVLTYVALAFGLALGVKALAGRRARQRSSAGDRTTTAGRNLDLVVFVGAAVGYILLIPLVGFFEISLVMLTAVSVYLGARRNRRLVLESAGIALAICVVGYAMFMKVLYVPVPMNDWVSRVLQAVGL